MYVAIFFGRDRMSLINDSRVLRRLRCTKPVCTLISRWPVLIPNGDAMKGLDAFKCLNKGPLGNRPNENLQLITVFFHNL